MPAFSQRRSEAASKQAWLITFTDLLALMLTFFVLLFAMSQIKMQAWEAFVEGITDRLNPKDEWREPALLTERQALRIRVQKPVNLDYLHAILKEKLETDPLLTAAILSRRDDRLIVSLPGDVMFAEDQGHLTASARDAVLFLGEALQFVANQVDVVGHAVSPKDDRGRAWGKRWAWSLRRAVSVAELLAAAGYVPQARAFGLGDGHYYDLDPKLSEHMRQGLGSRVDVVIRENFNAAGGDDG